jgi:murein DD-endopeptidase MepM/ murein hydrolase activator NlpD
VTPALRGSLELVWIPADGRERRLRVGRRVLAAAAAFALLLVASLLVFAALLPSLIRRDQLTREMDVALERRAQLGERLRALVEAAGAMQQQIQMHSQRVERIRILYGLPDLAGGPLPPHAQRVLPPTLFAAAILYAENLANGMEAGLARTDALIASLASWERQHADEARAVPALLPLPAPDAVLVRGFGPERDPVSGAAEFHAGLDLAAPEGELVRAPSAGVVRWAGDAPATAGALWWRLGQLVVIAHGNRYRTLYGHCGKLLVHPGQRVAAGDPIATVGTTGWTASPRLHYEVRRLTADGEWEAVDPRRLLLDLGPLASPLPASRAVGAASSLAPPSLPSAFVR